MPVDLELLSRVWFSQHKKTLVSPCAVCHTAVTFFKMEITYNTRERPSVNLVQVLYISKTWTYLAACKVEFQPFNRPYSQLTIFDTIKFNYFHIFYDRKFKGSAPRAADAACYTHARKNTPECERGRKKPMVWRN